MILVYEVQWALLRFDVKTSEIFADDPERHELHAAEEQHDDHQRGIALDRIAEDERLAENVKAEHEREQRGREPDVRRELQRRAAERRDAVDREVPEFPVIPLRFAGVARVAVIDDRQLPETDLGEKTFHEALALAHLLQRIERAARDQAEIAGVARNRRAR